MLSRVGLDSTARRYCAGLWRADSTSAFVAALYSHALPDSLALQWAERAIHLDSQLADAWMARGLIRWPHDYNGALRDMLRALTLDPSLTDAWRIARWLFVPRHDSLGIVRATAGELGADSSSITGILYYASHELRRSPRWGLIALDAIPRGRFASVEAARGQLLVRAGRAAEARGLAHDLLDAPEANDFAQRLYARAAIYASLGSADTAFASLALALEAGFSEAPMMVSDQDSWRGVWTDPRYAVLERAVATAHGLQLATRLAPFDSPATLVDTAARIPPPPLELRDSTGAPVSLADLRGKIVLLDFWSTWCSWCRIGMPQLSDFIRTLSADSVVALSIQLAEYDSTAWSRGAEIFRAGQYAMRYTKGTRATQDAMRLDALPTLVVIDHAGRVAVRHSGYLHDPRAVLSPLLAELQREP